MGKILGNLEEYYIIGKIWSIIAIGLKHVHITKLLPQQFRLFFMLFPLNLI